MEKRKFSSTFWEGVFLLFVSVFGVVMSLISHKDFNVEWKLSPYLFPLIISFFLLFLSISIILDGLKNKDEKKEKGKVDTKSLFLSYVSVTSCFSTFWALSFPLSLFLCL